jgi:hypothetical protein
MSSEGAANSSPPYLRDLVRAATANDTRTFAVVLFPSNPELGGVATSRLVEKAISKVDPAEALLAIGGDFTIEATRLLQDRGAIVVRRGSFGWTDESFLTLRDRAT